MMTQNRTSFLKGIRAVLPLLIGVIPFGMIYGVLAVDAEISPQAAQSMSWLWFAGAAQFIATPLIHNAVPALVIVLIVAVVNLRHVLYSASLAPFVKALSLRWKVLLSYLMVDEAYAIMVTHYNNEGVTPTSHWYFLGAGLTLWTTWQTSTAAGIFLGATLPPDWPLDFALPLTFIAIIMPVIKDRPSIAAALSAGVVAVLAYNAPYKSGLMLAAMTGILVGALLEGRK
jgi:4-azaleucine resistance transporter AzlC